LNVLGWKGNDRSPSSTPPATGRDTFHQTRLLKALSNLALNTASPALSAFPHRRGVPALGSFLWPPLDPLQQVHVCPVLGAPELDAGLQVGSH